MRLKTRIAITATASVIAFNATQAQVTLFTTGAGPNTTSIYGSALGPVAPIAVSANTTISAFGFFGGLTAATNVKFFIFDASTNTNIFTQIKAFGVTAPNSLILSDPFSLLLTGGRTYNFGFIASDAVQSATYFSSLSPVVTQGTFSNPGGNTNYGPYANPMNANQGGGSKLAIEIRGPNAVGVPTVTPEPASFALVAAGLMIVGGVARRRRLS